jgi:hypothetical protein
MRTSKQILALVSRIENKCLGDTDGLQDWLIEGNRVGGLTGRTDVSIIAEWNKYTKQGRGN